MQLQVILTLTLVVSFCNSTWITSRKNINSNKKRKNTDVLTNSAILDPNIREDAHLSTIQLIRKYRYPAEIHRAITEDGYILELHRIPRPGRVPVLLVHGLLDSSSTWVVTGTNTGFAYLLYDRGYDVWMANVRGNTYSRKHIRLNPNKAAFWNFTFHEIGIYDIPTTIDYILVRTNYNKLHYIGHSQGGTSFFIMCSLRPEYNRKIISMQALAPAVFIGQSKSPLVDIFLYFQTQIFVAFESSRTYEFLPSNDLTKTIATNFCKDGTGTQLFCLNILFLIFGYDKEQINSTLLPVFLGHSPAGSSTRQLLHFGQLIKSDRFRQFDYGKNGNLQKYGRTTPPDYDLTKVSAKVALHYGQNDLLVDPQGMEKLRQALPNVVGKYLVNFPKFNHMDFIWGIDVRSLLYEKVIALMQSIEVRHY